MLLALLPVLAAAELELGVGGQSLSPGSPDPALRGVTRLVLGHGAVDLSATWTPGPADPSALTNLMLSFGAPEWTERREQLSVSLLGDWILGEAESERFTGSPHLYGGVSGWQAARITSGRLEQSRTTERGLSPTLGGGLSAGVGPVSLRFMLTVSPQRDPMSEGLDPHLRGSWDLLVRPSTRSRTSR